MPQQLALKENNISKTWRVLKMLLLFEQDAEE